MKIITKYVKQYVFIMVGVFGFLIFFSFFGCSKRKAVDAYNPHPSAWMDLNSENFHGKKVVTIGNNSCKNCHGESFNGGESKISCYDCHLYPHPVGWLHSQHIKENSFDLAVCKTCHGSDYSGGRSEFSCNTCHLNSPEACNTCHGSSSNPAPPEDIDGNTATTSRGVGAHQAHVVYSQTRFACSECHSVPSSLNDTGHIDSALPAEMIWGTLARTDSLNPVWNGSTCSDVYCHGASLSGGSNTAPNWTVVDGSQAICGTCHGIPRHGKW